MEVNADRNNYFIPYSGSKVLDQWLGEFGVRRPGAVMRVR
jgi:hypothetical protein